MSLLVQKKKTQLTTNDRPETEKGQRETWGPRCSDSSTYPPDQSHPFQPTCTHMGSLGSCTAGLPEVPSNSGPVCALTTNSLTAF